MSVLSVKNLRKDYGDFILEDMQMSIEEGEVLGFVGANGAGKTTTIKSILNTIKPDAGTITVFDKSYEDSEREIKENIGVVLDDSFLPAMFTPKDVGTVMKQMYENWNQSYYEKLIKELEIPYTKKMEKFSSGMKVKVKIISALAHHPRFLVLDEPTAGLDPIARNEILQLLQFFVKKEHGSILISSHITTDLDNLADKIVFIHKGKLIFTKTMEQIQVEGGVEKIMLDYVKDEKDFLNSLYDENDGSESGIDTPVRGFVRPNSPAGRTGMPNRPGRR